MLKLGIENMLVITHNFVYNCLILLTSNEVFSKGIIHTQIHLMFLLSKFLSNLRYLSHFSICFIYLSRFYKLKLSIIKYQFLKVQRLLVQTSQISKPLLSEASLPV